jgi:glycosyltransferase involved in cell wall biosynthesis
MTLRTLTFLAICCTHLISANRISFTIITPTYNNAAYCIRNIKSVHDQTYPDWEMVIINDCSTDTTSKLLHSYIEEQQLSNKITIIDNQERHGALYNLYNAIHQCPDKNVIVTLDGDDWFATNSALERIAHEYQKNNAWITYGQFLWFPACVKGFCKPFPTDVMHHKKFRSYNWVSSHPRTFYGWLFKKINKEDLMYEGKFLSMAWDVAMMLPMLEMASDGHIACIEDILYTYNEDNPLNDHKVDLDLQRFLGFYAANKPPYPTITQAPSTQDASENQQSMPQKPFLAN